MDNFVSESISQWGAFGLIISCALYIIYDYIKNGKRNSRGESNITEEQITRIVDNRIESLSGNIDDKMCEMENKMVDLTNNIINNIQSINKKREHMNIQDLAKIGPKLHSTLAEYKDEIKVDHIFIGSFHNGLTSITGIPYYKFDIIVERFNPEENLQDVEFAPRYKNVDLLQYDKLPIALFNKEILYYEVNDDYTSDMQKMSEIVYHRMITRGVKQLVAIILLDENDVPNGFICGINYTKKELNYIKLKECRFELERIYKENKK